MSGHLEGISDIKSSVSGSGDSGFSSRRKNFSYVEREARISRYTVFKCFAAAQIPVLK
jgi:hypothetical protein